MEDEENIAQRVGWLIYDNLHRGSKCSFDAIRTNHSDGTDVEEFSSREGADAVQLVGREGSRIADLVDHVAHVVAETGLEAQHTEGDVQQTVVDGGSDASSRHNRLLGDASTLEAVGVALAVRNIHRITVNIPLI